MSQFYRLGMARFEKPMDWFTRDIDKELRSPNPPPGDMIVILYLMMDTDFMIAMLKKRTGPTPASIAGISRDPYHPLYSKIKHAFEWSEERRKLAGFRPNPWPMRFGSPMLKDRRLTWEPVMKEIKEAWQMYRRFIREGFRPFSVDSRGEPLVPVSCFDPQAGEIMFRVGD